MSQLLKYAILQLQPFRFRFSGALDDPQWGARLQVRPDDEVEDEILWMRMPRSGEYGEFLAVCRLFYELKLLRADILYNPGFMTPRQSFYVLSPEWTSDADTLDLTIAGVPQALAQIQGIALRHGRYLLNSDDQRWVVCAERVTEKKYRVEFGEEGEQRGTMMRMDLKAWNEPVCVVRHVFSVPGESIQENWDKMWKQFKDWESVNLVDHKDPESIMRYIESRNNLNFVNFGDKNLTVESEQIQDWLDTLAPADSEDPEYDRKIRTGVMIINNVVFQNLRDSNGAYAAKSLILNIFDKTPDCEAKHYTTEGIKRVTMSWHFSVTMGKKKRTQKYFWIDLWKESPLRARMTDVIFEPWPITKPACSPGANGERYRTNRPVNNFSGYRWDMEDLKKAYIDPEYTKSVSMFEKLISEGYTGKKEYTDYVIKWLAWTLQNPDEKAQVALIIKGPKGLGKGWLARFLDVIWGKNYLFIPSKGLEGDFNGHLADRVLVFIDEINPQNVGKGNIDAIKSMITERNGLTHAKNQDQRVSRSNINIIGATNNELEIEITPDNRRFFITESPISQHAVLSWRPFVQEMWEEFLVGDEAKQNNWLRIRAVFYYLVTMDLKGFVPHKELPWTPYMKKLVELTIPVVHNWWRFVIQRRQVASADVKNGEPCHRQRTYLELFTEFKHCDEFSRLYDSDRKKSNRLVSSQFASSLQEVMACTTERESGKFVIMEWQEQISRWNRLYPFSPIQYDPNDSITPHVAAKIAEMRSTVVDEEFKNLTREELEYALQRVRDEAEESGFNFTVNQSFFKRKTSEDLVVFENPNKRRKI